MAKKSTEEQSNQLNLTVVALVALVAIVGLVALVLQSANLAPIATGVQQASAEITEENIAGDAMIGVNCGAFTDSQLADMMVSNHAALQRVGQACAAK